MQYTLFDDVDKFIYNRYCYKSGLFLDYYNIYIYIYNNVCYYILNFNN